MISQSRMLVRAVRFSEYQIIFADFILPRPNMYFQAVFKNTEYKNEKKAKEFEVDCEGSY